MVAIAIAIVTIAGMPFVLLIDRNAGALELPALGFLYGSGLVYFVMLAMPAWSAVSVTVVILLLAAAAAAFSIRGAKITWPRPSPIDLLTLYTVAMYGLYATVARVWQWDFWMIWGIKAAQFFEAASIDWRFLQSQWNSFSHPDYPLLLPLNYTYIAMLNGAWDDRWLGLTSVAFGLALILIVRELASKESSPLIASAIAFAASAFALTAHVGVAEAPMICLGSAAVLYLRRGSYRHGAVLLGLAANCKNEGVALALCCALAMAVINWRSIRQLIPTAVMIVPWTILRAVHGLRTDLFEGSFVGRAGERLASMGSIGVLLVQHLQDRVLWICIIAGLLIVPMAAKKRERFVLVVTALQLLIFILIYLGTPMDVRTHIETSWPRLPRQIGVPLLVTDLLMLNATLRSE